MEATVRCQGKTGIEMEAITAATMGTVTLYDMLKAVDKGMVINGARVVAKSGGKSGDWYWDGEENRLVRGSKGDSDRAQFLSSSVEEGPSGQSRPISEIDEWNEGLAAEFQIKEEEGR